MLKADVCVLRLPPGFPVVPQYLGHTSVAPQPLTEPDKQISHIRLFTQTFGSGLNGFMLRRIRGLGQPTCPNRQDFSQRGAAEKSLLDGALRRGRGSVEAEFGVVGVLQWLTWSLH